MRRVDWRSGASPIANCFGRKLFLNQVENLNCLNQENLPALPPREPARSSEVRVRLGLKACASDGIVDSVWVRPDVHCWLSVAVRRESNSVGVTRQQLVGHVALRLRGSVVGREVRAGRHGVGDGLVHLLVGCRSPAGTWLFLLSTCPLSSWEDSAETETGAQQGICTELLSSPATFLYLIFFFCVCNSVSFILFSVFFQNPP